MVQKLFLYWQCIMQLKFQINKSTSYEYLLHGQDLHINYEISNCLFVFIIYRELHQRLWFHKFLTGTYYIAPFILLYNFCVNKKLPGFRNSEARATFFEYPGTSYHFNERKSSIWDYRLKLKLNSGSLQSVANVNYPTFTFIGIGLGFLIQTKKLNINPIAVKEEKFSQSPKIVTPHLKNHTNTPLKIDSKIIMNNPTCNLNKNQINVSTPSIDFKINTTLITKEIIN